MHLQSSLLVKLFVMSRRIGEFPIKRGSIRDATAHELRPRRDCNVWRRRLWQQAPKLWVKPAKIMTRAIAMGTDASAQPLDFCDQSIAVHLLQIVIHRIHQTSFRLARR